MITDRPMKIGGTYLPPGSRQGFSLLEVLVALAIFLFALIGIGRLLTLSGDRAMEVQQQGRAAQLCQAKLSEVIAGVLSLSSQSGGFDEDPDWQWSVDAQSDSSISGLWRVKVTVSRERPDGSKTESSLNQMVLDPSLRGSTTDTAATSNSSNSSSGTGSGTTGSGSGSGGQGGMAGGGAMPAKTPAAPPASSGAGGGKTTPKANPSPAAPSGGKSRSSGGM